MCFSSLIEERKSADPSEGAVWGQNKKMSTNVCGALEARNMKFRALVRTCRIKLQMGNSFGAKWSGGRVAGGESGGVRGPPPNRGLYLATFRMTKKMAK